MTYRGIPREQLIVEQTKKEAKEAEKKLTFVFDVKDERAIKELELQLSQILGTEAADQLLFSLKKLLFSDIDYTNQCNEAVHDLGKQFDTAFASDEESLFTLTQDLQPSYFDTRSTSKSLHRIGYHGDFHSVGRLQVNTEQGQFSILIDPTYGDVAASAKKGMVLCIVIEGGEEQSTGALSTHYGGTWRDEFRFNPKNQSYRWIEDET